MRLLTRSDFDGLICAVLLKHVGMMDEWKFVHPKDVQDGLVQVTKDDILANVPYVPGVGMWFDHHSSEKERIRFDYKYEGTSELKPSCARVIWDYFGGKEKFPELFQEMMEYVDKCDSGQLTREEVLEPKGWVLLSFIMDPRTGLGRYKDYRISNYNLMMKMVEWCGTMPIDEILAQPDVQERVNRYFKQNVVFTVGHSIIKRTSKTDVGKLMLEYDGGGHERVGTCQVATPRAERIKKELIERVAADG